MAKNKSTPDQPPLVDVKQRIVGAIVIISLAIIFLPMVLNKKPIDQSASPDMQIPAIPDELKQSVVTSYKKIPSPPEMPQISEPEVYLVNEHNVKNIEKIAKQIDSQQSKTETKTNTAPRQTSKKTEAKPKPASTRKAIKENNKSPYKDRFIVQLGTFSKIKNAQDLTYKLRKKRFKSYLEMIKLSGKAYYRVRVGPFILKHQAQKNIERINQQFKIKGRLIKD